MSKIYVYDNFTKEEVTLLGILTVDELRGKEIYSFEFCDERLINNMNISIIDPNLYFYNGKQYSINGEELFGFIMDSCPDRWGRMLIKRKEELLAYKENRNPRALKQSDYLLGISDYLRMGALRFKTEIDGPFLSDDNDLEIPPISNIREIESAIKGIESDNVDENWLDILFTPGSSLGGARPKANIKDLDNSLWIAKFPSKNDEYDVGALEMLAHELAILCGINVPEAKTIKTENGTIYLSKRFDRENNKRIHFSSAMTMLNKKDGEDASYLDILNFIKQYGANPKDDIKELWKRLLFNILISNSDDHLRNHGFILKDNNWILSPAYDINPSIDKSHLSLFIDYEISNINIDPVLNVSGYFNINANEAKDILLFMQKQINDNLEKLCKKNNITNNTYQLFKKAFKIS